MCKESMLGSPCPACGNRIYYVEQHYEHCRQTIPASRKKVLRKLKQAFDTAVNNRKVSDGHVETS